MNTVGVLDPLFGNTYYIETNLKHVHNEYVVFSDPDGYEFLAKVRIPHHDESKYINAPLEDHKIIRSATPKDLECNILNLEKQNDVLEAFNKSNDEAGLNLDLYGYEYSLDHKKIKIYFYSVEKVDFRDLIKSFLKNHKGRVKLQFVQVQGREYASLDGGIGICGLDLCCHNLSYKKPYYPKGYFHFRGYNLFVNLNNEGSCGSNQCCSLFEVEEYLNTVALIPDYNTKVMVKGVEYVCRDLDVLRKKITLLNRKQEKLELSFSELGEYLES